MRFILHIKNLTKLKHKNIFLLSDRKKNVLFVELVEKSLTLLIIYEKYSPIHFP